MGKLMALFNKAGGKEILRQYARAGVLPHAMLQMLLGGFSKKSLEIVRLSVNNKVLTKLRKKYSRFICEYVANETEKERIRSNKVWVCWLQGMENAPALVQRCYRSLQESLPDREIILLTEDNYRDYVTFPVHVQEKFDRGLITRTHMSDLLRLELLLNHGGTWIDATVLCTGGEIPSYMLDSDLFVFQTLKPGADGQATILSSWFMTACTNHPILALTRALLYKYWKKRNGLVDYFLLHDFFQLAIEAYPEEFHKVLPFCNSLPHILLLRLFDTYDETQYQAICKLTPFHKLTYKFPKENTDLPDTFYQHLMDH